MKKENTPQQSIQIANKKMPSKQTTIDQQPQADSIQQPLNLPMKNMVLKFDQNQNDGLKDSQDVEK